MGADQTGLLVEAFPAAQLSHWGMKHDRYDSESQERCANRKELVASLSKLVEVSDDALKRKMEQTADALDAVLCAFAAIAVSKGRLAQSPEPSDEGQIAVHEEIEQQRS